MALLNQNKAVYTVIPYKEKDNWYSGKSVSAVKIGQTSYDYINGEDYQKCVYNRVNGMATAFSEDYYIIPEYIIKIPVKALPKSNRNGKADDILRKILLKIVNSEDNVSVPKKKEITDPWRISCGQEWVYNLRISHMKNLKFILEKYEEYIIEGDPDMDLMTYVETNPKNLPILNKLNKVDNAILKLIEEIPESTFTEKNRIYSDLNNVSYMTDAIKLNKSDLFGACCIIAKSEDEYLFLKKMLESKGCKDISVFFINKFAEKEFVNKYSRGINTIYTINNLREGNMPKFDYIIQNPPYSGSFHLQFLEKGISLLKPSGKMTIIEPATWLINVRKNGKATLYDEIKEKLGKHVYKVVIENYNKEFDTAMYVPFAVTYIDMDKTYDKIDFYCCGEHRVVDNIYDCNMIGSYKIIWSILNKIKAYGEKVGTMKDHIYKEGKTKVDENTWFCKYPEIMGGMGAVFCASAQSSHVRGGYNYDTSFNISQFGEHLTVYTNVGWHLNKNKISHNPLHSCNAANKETDKIANNLFGTKQELENWKHFIFNSRIPLFTSIVLVIDQNNTCKDVLCWLTDKQYTDEEIYQLLGITEEEQKFIDKTLKRYERNSPWFKRYMCGKDSVSDEEVQKFIDSL